MYKGASRRSGAPRFGRGIDFFGQWRASLKRPAKLHPLAERLLQAAFEQGGVRPFVRSLSDFWLAEAIRMLVEDALLEPNDVLDYWTTVPSRFESQQRRIRLSASERREGELILTSKLVYWAGENPYNPLASMYGEERPTEDRVLEWIMRQENQPKR